jgi:hypothetical protein
MEPATLVAQRRRRRKHCKSCRPDFESEKPFGEYAEGFSYLRTIGFVHFYDAVEIACGEMPRELIRPILRVVRRPWQLFWAGPFLKLK